MPYLYLSRFCVMDSPVTCYYYWYLYSYIAGLDYMLNSEYGGSCINLGIDLNRFLIKLRNCSLFVCHVFFRTPHHP